MPKIIATIIAVRGRTTPSAIWPPILISPFPPPPLLAGAPLLVVMDCELVSDVVVTEKDVVPSVVDSCDCCGTLDDVESSDVATCCVDVTDWVLVGNAITNELRTCSEALRLIYATY
jgi:hypothetical protein